MTVHSYFRCSKSQFTGAFGARALRLQRCITELLTSRWSIRRSGAIALILALCGVPNALGQERRWRNPNSGVYQNSANWVGGVVPGPNDTPVFGLNGSTAPFTVSFTGNVQTNHLNVINQRPAFDLGGFTYTVSNEFNVGGTNAPGVTLTNGTVNSRLAGGGGGIGRAFGQSGALTIGAGATLRGLNVVGESGTGTLNIEQGGHGFTRSGESMAAGFLAGSTGSVVVDGAGSTLYVHNELRIGDSGAGSLLVDNGATLEAGSLRPGSNSGAAGNVTVRGTGSMLTCGYLGTGGGGSGNIRVQAGAQLAVAGNVDGHGIQDWLISGEGSQLTIGGDARPAANGGSASLLIENGADALVQWTAFTDSSPASHGTVTIRGVGSTYTGAYFNMMSGTAAASIEDGATMTINESLGLGCCNHGGAMTFQVTGTGSELRVNRDIFVGGSGTNATLTVANGGRITAPPEPMQNRMYIGDGGEGHVFIDGVGSTVDLYDLTAHSGVGELQITNGARMNVANQFLMGCCRVNNNRSLVVRGAGSELQAGNYPITNGSFYLGFESDQTTATVDQGGRVFVRNNAYIGHRGTGLLTIDGAASRFETSYRLHVGWYDSGGHGDVRIQNGAMAALGSLWMLGGNGSTATAAIDSGSLVTILQGADLYEGAALTIADAAALEMTGYVNLYGTSIRPATMVVAGAGSYSYGAGVAVGGNPGEGGAGILTLNDGGQVFATGGVHVRTTGTMRGTGMITGSIYTNGLISVGDPIGELSCTNIYMEPLSVLRAEVGGTQVGAQYDRLAATNDARLAGRMELTLANGFSPVIGQTFDVITAAPGRRTGTFASIGGTDLGAGRAFVVQNMADRVRLLTDSVTDLNIVQPSLLVHHGYVEPLSASATFVSSPPQIVTGGAVWTSDNATIAEVDNLGRVRGVAPGSTIIRATYSGFEDTVLVTVGALPIAPGVTPGLEVLYYDFLWPFFEQLSPVHSETRPTLTVEWSPCWDCGYGNAGLTGDARIGAIHEAVINVPAAGEYTFHAVDGLGQTRLYINDDLITADSIAGFNSESSGDIALPAGPATVRFEYAKHGNYGGYGSRVEWSGPGFSRQEIASTVFEPPGVHTRYYELPPPILPENITEYMPQSFPLWLTGETDALNFQFNSEPRPTGDLGGDAGATFTGWLTVPTDGQYMIYMQADEGARLYIDETLQITRNGYSSQWGQASLALAAGLHAFRCEYYERGYFWGLEVQVEGPGISRQPIPPTGYFHGTPIVCTGGNGDGDGSGTTDGDDIRGFVDTLLAGGTPGESYCRYDMNGDSVVDQSDVVPFAAALSQQ